jgi:hypothetical protein
MLALDNKLMRLIFFGGHPWEDNEKEHLKNFYDYLKDHKLTIPEE